MNKHNIIIILVVLLAAGIGFAIKYNSQMIIQGEVDTKTVDLSSKIAGRTEKINVVKGDYVNKDDVLIILDTPEIKAKVMQSEATLDMAEAKNLEIKNGAREEEKAMALNAYNQAQVNLELAQKTYTRMKRLNQEGVISDQKFDEVSMQYQSAKKAVSIAKEKYQMYKNGARYEDKLLAEANVKKAQGLTQEVNSYLSENKIKTPISGQVTEIYVEEGELVGAGYPIVSITDVDDNWVVFNLREDLLSKIKLGSVFEVKVPALGNKVIPVQVNYISAMGNFSTWRATKTRGDFDMKTFEVHAKPLDKVDGLIAGMSVITDWNKIK